MEIHLNSHRVARLLAIMICGLVAAHCVSQAMVFKIGDDYLHGFGPLFDLDDEANLPTFFSSLAMLLAAGILACIGRYDPLDRRAYWLALSAVFLVLAIDETVSIHEIVGNLFDTRFDTSGYLYYSWIVPYSALLVVFSFFFLRFLFRLPLKIRALMVAAGAMFVAGAIGLEAVAARHDELAGPDDLTYAALATVEEIFEMSGVALFIYALLSYLEKEHGRLRISVGLSGQDSNG